MKHIEIWCKLCIPILHHPLSDIWSSQNLPTSWKQRFNNILHNVFKLGGFCCWTLPKEFWQNMKSFGEKMAMDNPTYHQTKFNYERMLDLQILLQRLACIFLLLKFVHVFIKFAQMWNVFVFDLMAIIKVSSWCFHTITKTCFVP
jgi:hypothetical protein